MVDQNKYITHRKKSLKELGSLFIQRDRLSKQIRAVRRELDSWDRCLIEE